MQRTRKGGLQKEGEVGFSSDDTYSECVTAAISALDWDYDPIDGYPCLCRISGQCRILDQPILSEDGVRRPWTISNYLRSAFVSSSNYKLGVGLFEVRAVAICLNSFKSCQHL